MVSDAKVGWNRFRGELEALQACAGVFVISREEQWLLESIGIAAEYFPYVPAESRRQWLSGVRSQRTACVQDSILVLGTQSNEPTRRGVSEILAALGGRTEAHRIVVVGVGSDEITGSATDGPGIHKVGFLSEEDLVKEMARAKVALVWQPSTSGWPTRLVELPECGIPVIANPGALRAQESFPGVVLARTPAEAVDLLQGPISIDEIGEVATEAGIELSKVRAMIADAELDLVR
jgi:glycosyltransferase involved in cell wall biosynthesis